MENALVYWDVSPELFTLGPLTVRWYGLLFAASFFVGYHIFRWIFQLEDKPEEDLDRLLLFMMGGTILGARLGHCLFYDPVYYLSNPLELFKIWQGGLASHGAVIGIFTALYLYARQRPQQPYLWVLDRMVISIALGGFFIRLGNLFNSEILGVPTDKPWAFVFARYDSLPRHPTQLYESLAYGSIFVVLFLLYRKLKGRTPHGLILGLFLSSVFGFRFLVEFTKIRQAAFAEDWTLSMGQLLSVPLVVLGLVFLLRSWQVGAPAEPSGES